MEINFTQKGLAFIKAGSFISELKFSILERLFLDDLPTWLIEYMIVALVTIDW